MRAFLGVLCGRQAVGAVPVSCRLMRWWDSAGLGWSTRQNTAVEGNTADTEAERKLTRLSCMGKGETVGGSGDVSLWGRKPSR